jgi:hypothetical protein
MWFTDQQIQAIPAFAGLSPDQLAQAAADAGQLYAQIAANPGVQDADLRAWAEGAGIPPERYNVAVEALQQAGKAVDVPASAIGPQPAPAPADSLRAAVAAGPPLVRAEHFTVAELRAAAGRAKLEVPRSATKDDLAAALASAG